MQCAKNTRKIEHLRQFFIKIPLSQIRHALLPMRQKVGEKSITFRQISIKIRPSQIRHALLAMRQKAREKSITFRQISIKIRPSKIRHALLAMRQIGARCDLLILSNWVRRRASPLARLGWLGRSDLLILSNWVRRRASPLARLGWLGRHYQKMSSKSRRYGVAMHQNPSKIATTQNDKLHRKASEINIEKATLRCCNASKPVQNSVRNQLTVCRLP